MCGVVSIVYAKDNPALGREAASLVRHLEYRGYDSTGVATVGQDGRVALRKSVGAPSRVVEALDIAAMAGQKAIGQVRWATYGSVTDTNAQPHEVRCRVHVVGAHNGNISNTDALKEFLQARGHAVASDNDGEMLVHVVEHYFSEEGGDLPDLAPAERRAAALRAIRRANKAVQGSYAACLSLPGIPGVFAVKAGSSLYAGKGRDGAGEFIVVSSDLTSVLSKTRFLVPLAEGEGLHFTEGDYAVFSLAEDREWVPPLRRSRLNVADIELQAPFRFFMEQEIAQAGPNLLALDRYYFAHAEEAPVFAAFEAHADDARALVEAALRLSQAAPGEELAGALREIADDPRLGRFRGAAPATAGYVSEEAALFEELVRLAPEERGVLVVLDRLVYWDKKRRVLQAKAETLAALAGARTIHLVGAGTSTHACLTAASFFATLAGLTAHPSNPGLFRSAYLQGLREGDVVVGVTQSGETKDLVDVFNDVRARHGRSVRLLSLVNNENSTIPQEKSDAFLPILCGPEIAVAATKSFVSQLALFYVLAASLREEESAVRRRLEVARRLVAETLEATREAVAEVAAALFLRPSIHVLGASLLGVAREGALKIREVVLNHTEGYDAAEFKHGPNTILGRNTLFSIADLRQAFAAGRAGGEFDAAPYFSNYPLVFLCPPDEREVRITVSQIHTHKIRGADVVVIAEEDDALRRAALGRPDRVPGYRATFVAVPPSGDPCTFAFQASVVLQALALRMSIAKMEYLEALGVRDHGVHPDVPKNVSKSITVD